MKDHNIHNIANCLNFSVNIDETKENCIKSINHGMQKYLAKVVDSSQENRQILHKINIEVSLTRSSSVFPSFSTLPIYNQFSTRSSSKQAFNLLGWSIGFSPYPEKFSGNTLGGKIIEWKIYCYRIKWQRCASSGIKFPLLRKILIQRFEKRKRWIESTVKN